MEITELTKDLMKFKTVKGNDEEFENVFDYIERYFLGTGLEVFHHEENGSCSMVIATDEEPDIMLHGHIDVVDADEEMFNPEEKERRIYGRGSADMKSGVACLMKAVKEVSTDSDISVGLMVVSDEEIGGFNGAQYLMRKKAYSPEFALSAEPDTTGEKRRIITKQKGIMRIVIKAEGEGAHGSTPWEGVNAAEKLWKGFEQVKQNFNMEKEWASTVNLGYFNSGKAMNVVPELAEAGLDIRWTKEYRPEEIISSLEDVKELEFKVEAEDPQLDTDKNNDFVQNLLDVSNKHCETKIGQEVAASDMRHFSEQEIPAVVFGPMGENIHGKGEFVEKESIETFYNVILEFLRTYRKGVNE